eukprot:766477-Hanusia_phi.AAC.1
MGDSISVRSPWHNRRVTPHQVTYGLSIRRCPRLYVERAPRSSAGPQDGRAVGWDGKAARRACKPFTDSVSRSSDDGIAVSS